MVTPTGVVAGDAARLLLEAGGNLDVSGHADPDDLAAHVDRVPDVLKSVGTDHEVELVVREGPRLAIADVETVPRVGTEPLPLGVRSVAVQAPGLVGHQVDPRICAGEGLRPTADIEHAVGVGEAAQDLITARVEHGRDDRS